MYIVSWCPEQEAGWKCTHSYSPEGRWHSTILPTLQDEMLGCRASPGYRCFRWFMFICDIFPTLPCYITLPRQASGSVGGQLLSGAILPALLEQAEAIFLSVGNHSVCLCEETTSNSCIPGTFPI